MHFYGTHPASSDAAIATLPQEKRNQPKFVLAAIDGVLDTASYEYEAAISPEGHDASRNANGKIVEDIEYQDSRGFVIYAQEMYEGIASQMQTAHPEQNKAITSSMSELIKAWPSVIAPSAPAKTPEEVAKLVDTIEENSQPVIKS